MNPSLRFWIGWGTVLTLVFALVVWGLLRWNLTKYSELVSDRLLLLAELRQGAVQEYFATADAELHFWSTNPDILKSQAALLAIWDADDSARQVRRNYVDENPSPAGYYLNLEDAGDGSAYSELHRIIHPRARLFVTERGYYDFFLIGPDGDLMYSVEKEPDFATNLETGVWKDSGRVKIQRESFWVCSPFSCLQITSWELWRIPVAWERRVKPTW